MDACVRCGAQEYYEEDGLFFCGVCQTQCRGLFTAGRDEENDPFSFIATREIAKGKQKRKRHTSDVDVGVPWTTIEAFNLIFMNQIDLLCHIPEARIDENKFKLMAVNIWFRYLRVHEILLVDNELDEGHKFHPAARYRDVQILTGRQESLGKVSYGLSRQGTKYFRLGDMAMREKKEDAAKEMNVEEETEQNFEREMLEGIRNAEEMLIESESDDEDVFDEEVFENRFKFEIPKTREKLISVEKRRQLYNLHKQFDLETTFKQALEEFVMPEVEDILATADEQETEENVGAESRCEVNEREKVECLRDDLINEIKIKMNVAGKVYSRIVSFEYLRKYASGTRRDIFIGHLALIKPLAIINLILRQMNCQIFASDLIRWINQFYFPYFFATSCFPENWKLYKSDQRMFIPPVTPIQKTINILAAKIGNSIGLKVYPMPNLDILMKRFLIDFNLPFELIEIINKSYNLVYHFSKKLVLNTNENNNNSEKIPFYEGWVLMAIVMVLKRIFVFDGVHEYRICESLKSPNQEQLFNWSEWEKYTRSRIELIKSHSCPVFGDRKSYLEELQDSEVLTSFLKKYINKKLEISKNFLSSSQCQLMFDDPEFRSELSQDFQKLSLGINSNTDVNLLEPTIYPLQKATDFCLNRIRFQKDLEEVKLKLGKDFTKKLITPWFEDTNYKKSYHRNYVRLNNGKFSLKNMENLPKSLKLLVELSCITLNCDASFLYPILIKMEEAYFPTSSKSNSRRKFDEKISVSSDTSNDSSDSSSQESE